MGWTEAGLCFYLYLYFFVLTEPLAEALLYYIVFYVIVLCFFM